MRQFANGIVTALVLVGAIGGFGLLLWSNSETRPTLSVAVPTQLPPTDDPNAWQRILRQGFGDNSTPLPTVPLPTEPFVPPTLDRGDDDANIIQIEPATVSAVRTPEPFSIPVTATLPQTTPTPLVLGDVVAFTEQPVLDVTRVWQPPPLIPPLSRDALGRDHYWFIRPVDSNATNFGLFYYPYGSNGPEGENPWRVHHGIDMPNPVGETVRAAGGGEVIAAASSLRIEDTEAFQNSPSYGNVVLIEHDFGYRGQPLYTLYAHLSAVLVERGQYVNAGDVIGLVGNTGRVSGPHVHFEVRLGEDRYRATVNPVLWMVPYVDHGVVAGRVVDERDEFKDDITVTLRNWATGLTEDTTTTYVFVNNGSDVNPDPIWNENFAFGDVPTGRYELVATIDGRRVSKIIDVVEGTTNFVELKPEEPATPQPAEQPIEQSADVFADAEQ